MELKNLLELVFDFKYTIFYSIRCIFVEKSTQKKSKLIKM